MHDNIRVELCVCVHTSWYNCIKKYTNDCKFIIKMHDLIIYVEMTIYKKLNSRMFKSQYNSFIIFIHLLYRQKSGVSMNIIVLELLLLELHGFVKLNGRQNFISFKRSSPSPSMNTYVMKFSKCCITHSIDYILCCMGESSFAE